MSRIGLVCPGRGSYTEASLGSLANDHPWVKTADRIRAGFDLEPIAALHAREERVLHQVVDPVRHLVAEEACDRGEVTIEQFLARLLVARSPLLEELTVVLHGGRIGDGRGSGQW